MVNSSDVPVERRQHPRTMVQLMLKGIRLDPEDGDIVDTLRMVDISRSGMGAFLERQAYRGQRFVLRLPLTEAGGRRNIYATVLRCRQKKQGYRVGLQFDSISEGNWCGVSTAISAAA
ncbi:MAG TPA: PilZ domain-containing protein [Phycisphaerae bacterium]|nr:PilZ domain-containing protein [Phycisphaerae bacterium]